MSIQGNENSFFACYLKAVLDESFHTTCKGSTIAPLSDYENNPLFPELSTLNKYFTSADEKKLIDLRCGKG